ncbi:MAG: GspE/PulE/PilB domain-containing protein, partial [Desulfobulbaceae bacterium]
MKTLGQVLVESYGVLPEVVAQGLAIQEEKGGRLGEILVQQKHLSSSDLLKARSTQCGLELMLELPVDSDPFFTPRVPIHYLKKFKMIPVATPSQSFIAIAEPFFFQQLDDLQRILDWQGMKTVLVPQEEIFKAINMAYDRSSQVHADQVMHDMDEENPEA